MSLLRNSSVKAVCVLESSKVYSASQTLFEPQGIASASQTLFEPQGIAGIIYFEEFGDLTLIQGKIKGLKSNGVHAIHIHEYGDLTEGCTSCCAHYNPFNMNHGGPKSADRHVGDLGNLQANTLGIAEFKFTDDLVKLWGQYSVIGRSIVVHEDPDDFGLGGHSDSLKTGHAGKRIVCGIIGYRSPNGKC